MIFSTETGAIVRIPNDKLCGMLGTETGKACVWCANDIDTDGGAVAYSVSREVFLGIMRRLGDDEVEA